MLAIIHPDGSKEHWSWGEGLMINGRFRVNLIQVKTEPDGSKCWYRNGQLHREDGPAVEWANGDKFWYRNGQLHREDGPAEEWADGDKFWYRNGQLHREDGPAVERPYGGQILVPEWSTPPGGWTGN